MSDAIDEKEAAFPPVARPDTEPDARRPYEPPRILKRRSIERATLVTFMGPAMTGLTVMG